MKKKRKIPFGVAFMPALIFYIVTQIIFLHDNPTLARKYLSIGQKLPSRHVTRELNDNDIYGLSGYSQPAAGFPNTIISFKAPEKKPQLQWKIGSGYRVKHYGYKWWWRGDTILVDSEGGTWFSYGSGIGLKYFLTKINSDGSVAWDMTPSSLITNVDPVLALNGAVICIITKSPDKTAENILDITKRESIQYLECFDLQGKSIWRSDVIKNIDPSILYSFDHEDFIGEYFIKRISGDRIIYVANNYPDPVPGIFYKPSVNFYSLRNGERLDNLSFYNWNSEGPIFVDDSEYLGLIPRSDTDLNMEDVGFLTCFKQDQTIAWESDLTMVPDSMLILGNDDNLICEPIIDDFVHKIDTKSGEIIWSYPRQNHQRSLKGITSEDQYIVQDMNLKGSDTQVLPDNMKKTLFHVLGSDGVLINSFEIPIFHRKPLNMVIYSDDNILVSSSDRLFLFDIDGNIYWNLGRKELGLTDESKDPYKLPDPAMLLYPAPGNRIVVYVKGELDYYIVSLGPKL